MYKPQNQSEHVNIVDFLNDIDKRLQKLENGNSNH